MEVGSTSNLLKNNKVSKFILRIDLQDVGNLKFEKLANDLKGSYSEFKTEMEHNLNVEISTQKLSIRDFTNYILITSYGVVIRLNTREKSIILTSEFYTDNSIYKKQICEIIDKISNTTNVKENEITAKRIGMRYINTFPCNVALDIKKILNPIYANSLFHLLQATNNLTRVIQMEEFQEEDNYVRVQYGVPNKYYPSKILNYDLLLDIDVYRNGSQSIDSWEESIKTFNHKAYDIFKSYIKNTYINKLR